MRQDGWVRRTLVAVHAHPDDEALLTGGTMAKASAAGHRVVLVVVTDGDLGLASADFGDGGTLGRLRLEELAVSARALGVHRVEYLGYADSGLGPAQPPDPPGRIRLLRADRDEIVQRIAELLRQENADVVLSYDPNGGYGHRDHIVVHDVVARAAAAAATPRLLEATVPRDTICRALAVAGLLYRFPPDFDPTSFQRAYSARSDITHRINVVRHAAAKRASMAAHASQASATGDADRTLAAFLRLPRPVYDIVFGREWFVDPAATPGGRVSRDVFEGLPHR
ncbi:MAG TPA: PIG-L family deacetylase [Dermatophilaceae bacterium]|nr:PIG-L family deacetylase [Dermatophilaceae bacterium]